MRLTQNLISVFVLRSSMHVSNFSQIESYIRNFYNLCEMTTKKKFSQTFVDLYLGYGLRDPTQILNVAYPA